MVSLPIRAFCWSASTGILSATTFGSFPPVALTKESEAAAARRELLEETGFRATSWKRVLKYWASPGFVAESMALYLARGLRPGKAKPEEDEVIEVRFFPLQEAVSMVLRGAIRDSKTIAGVLWLAYHQSRQKPRL